jgi:hypothetical protein
MPVLLVLLAAAPAPAQLWDRLQKLVNPEVEVQLTHPPDLGIRIQRLAFAPVATPVEADLVQALIADLSGSGAIEVLDRANVERILSEQKFSNSGLVDEQTAVELGRLLGSPALVIVKVHHFAFNPSRRQTAQTRKEKIEKKEVEKTVTTHFARKQGDFVASIQAVDLASGRIHNAKRVVASPSLENSQQDTPPDFPGDGQVRELAIAQAVAQVRKMLLPWNEPRRLVFFDDSDYGMKAAYGRLKAKDYPGALSLSQEARSRAGADSAARPKTLGRISYNVGLCHFILGDCESGLPFLKAALDSEPDSGIYRDALAECTRGAQFQEELRKAAGKAGVPAAPAASAGRPSLEERLQKLDGLFKKGLISEDDFRKRKEELLKEI